MPYRAAFAATDIVSVSSHVQTCLPSARQRRSRSSPPPTG